jgi:hypothetical protein
VLYNTINSWKARRDKKRRAERERERGWEWMRSAYIIDLI